MRNALHLSWVDVRTRYRKSVLGPLWLTLGNTIAIVGFSAVWAQLLRVDRAVFVPSLTVGLVIWQYISGCLTSSVTAYTQHAAVMRNLRMPVWFFVVRIQGYHLINFAHNLLLVAAVLCYFGARPTTGLVWFLPGLLLVVAICALLSLALAALGARYRDVRYAIEVSLPLLFFVSPVLFRPESLVSEYIWLNPVSYLIEVVRTPLLSTLGGPLRAAGWVYDGGLIFLGVMVLVCAAIYWRNPRRILFWI
ncbi:ABC transporter permease [Bordetella genomosp. 12]|uniref:ABC transporter permease n=1 Tax=Bordetella genomosp. 12 TaxID=463035 RepID=UPI001FCA28AA|nr:ABC transporter permease [Bordetella genomosp. 12]